MRKDKDQDHRQKARDEPMKRMHVLRDGFTSEDNMDSATDTKEFANVPNLLFDDEDLKDGKQFGIFKDID